MSITLGAAPQKLNVILTKDADFFAILRSADGDWGSGTQIELRLGSTVWPAEIDGTDAIISADAEQVNRIYAAQIHVAKLFYINGSTDVCWALGKVVRSA